MARAYIGTMPRLEQIDFFCDNSLFTYLIVPMIYFGFNKKKHLFVHSVDSVHTKIKCYTAQYSIEKTG